MSTARNQGLVASRDVMTIRELMKKSQETRETKQKIRVKRLDAELTLRALSYDEIGELRRKNDGELDIYVCLYGIAEPELQTEEFCQAADAVLPAEGLKKLLTPGEIQDISRRIQRLSGYFSMTIEDVKKK